MGNGESHAVSEKTSKTINTLKAYLSAQDALDALATLVDRGDTALRVLAQLAAKGPLRGLGPALQARLDAAWTSLDAIGQRMEARMRA